MIDYRINTIQYYTLANIIKNHYEILMITFYIVDSNKLTVKKYLIALTSIGIVVFPNASEWEYSGFSSVG